MTSCAFLSGQIQGDCQYGSLGEKTLMAIPIPPDGEMEPNFDPVTGKLKESRQKHSKSFILNHGGVYATTLELTGIQSSGKEGNERSPMKFVLKS
ncbi:hypothetical protein OAE51_01770 [bacterium]|nr:hypothetical protein [bacterium]